MKNTHLAALALAISLAAIVLAVLSLTGVRL